MAKRIKMESPEKTRTKVYKTKITFSEYRSECLKILWKEELDLFGIDQRTIIQNPNFSTWRIDDICAECWKKNRLFLSCVSDLVDYIKEEVL